MNLSTGIVLIVLAGCLVLSILMHNFNRESDAEYQARAAANLEQVAAQAPEPEAAVQVWPSDSFGKNTYHDNERNVTCWVVVYGIDCMPDSMWKNQ